MWHVISDIRRLDLLNHVMFMTKGNIITASEVNISREMPGWKQEYLKTSNKVIMAETLSPTFVGMSFQVGSMPALTKITNHVNLPGGSWDLLCETQPHSNRHGGQKVRRRKYLDKPSEQESRPELHRSVHHQEQRLCQESLVLLSGLPWEPGDGWEHQEMFL